MKIQREQLILELLDYNMQHLQKIDEFKLLTDKELNQRPTDGGWTILECIEHLNQYGRFYLPEMYAAIRKDHQPGNEQFIPSWIGNYFAIAMLPSSNKKMKAMKNYNPSGRLLGRELLDEFYNQLKDVITILELAKEKNLTKIKCNISLTRFIKLRLGDTLRVVIYHNERHILQASKVLKNPS